MHGTAMKKMVLCVCMCMYVGILLLAEGANQGNVSMFITQGNELPKSF
jgi:hypothetical protein